MSMLSPQALASTAQSDVCASAGDAIKMATATVPIPSKTREETLRISCSLLSEGVTTRILATTDESRPLVG